MADAKKEEGRDKKNEGREKKAERSGDRVSKGSNQEGDIPQETQNEKEKAARSKG